MQPSSPLASPDPLNPFSLLQAAMKAAPGVTRWVLAALGLIAGASIVTTIVKSPLYGITAVVGLLVAMVALFIFSRVTAIAAKSTRTLALVFVWFGGLVIMATVGCVFSSAFFGSPWPIKQKLFATTVALRAQELGAGELADAIKGLSPEAITKLIEINDSRHDLGYFDPHTGDYYLSPVPKPVWELEQQGLVEWAAPKDQFASLVTRLGLTPWAEGPSPQILDHSHQLTPEDREALRTFSYHLNSKGISLYKLVLEAVIRQAREV